uniref:T2.6 protein n=1 Tax=Malus x robusta TaxID=1184610 RepID=I7J3I9_9ROSA|nr:T2.6 [Malus x robusta]
MESISNLSPNQNFHTSSCKKIPPAFGWIKCNFDAAWDGKKSIGGFGLVVRDSEGSFLAAQVSSEGDVRSALHAEVAAARAAALFLRRSLTEQVQVEGDALLVISAIQNAGAAYSGHYGHMFDDRRRLLQDLNQWKITFGRRETNKVALRLVRFSLTVDHIVSWFEEPPDYFFSNGCKYGTRAKIKVYGTNYQCGVSKNATLSILEEIFLQGRRPDPLSLPLSASALEVRLKEFEIFALVCLRATWCWFQKESVVANAVGQGAKAHHEQTSTWCNRITVRS